MVNYHQIRRELTALLEHYKCYLRPDTVRDVIIDMNAGEEFIALDTLIDQLQESDAQPSEADLEKLRSLADLLGLKDPFWKY